MVSGYHSVQCRRQAPCCRVDCYVQGCSALRWRLGVVAAGLNIDSRLRRSGRWPYTLSLWSSGQSSWAPLRTFHWPAQELPVHLPHFNPITSQEIACLRYGYSHRLASFCTGHFCTALIQDISTYCSRVSLLNSDWCE